jgi:hypothetical protein
LQLPCKKYKPNIIGIRNARRPPLHIIQQQHLGNTQALLNPNHTHFLLVDDGQRFEKSEPQTARFRAHLEQNIQENCTVFITKFTIVSILVTETTVVCLLVEGAATSLDQVYESIKRKIPVLV